MKRLLAIFALALGALALPGQAIAQGATTTRTIAVERWVEEWDPATQRWVRVSDSPSEALATGRATSITTTQVVNGEVVDESETVPPPTGTMSRRTPAT